MIAPRWIIHPSLEELETVCRYVSTTQPDETEANGVWVRYDDMQRVWTGSVRDTTWEVRGGLSIESQPCQHLPARAVREAYFIAAGEDAESVTLLVPSDGGVVIVQSTVTETVIDLHHYGAAVPDAPDRISAARAIVNAGRLCDLVNRARTVPIGGTSEALPDPVLTILNGAIAVHTDWSVRGAQRTTYRCEAITEDEAQCVLPLGLIHDAVRLLDRDTEVEIDLPVDPSEPIILREPTAWSTYPCRPADARRFADEVIGELLAMVGEGFEIVEYGSFRFETDDRCITVQLLDAPDPVVRIATVVCDGLGGMFTPDDLLGHINEMNSGIVGGRLWFDRGVVWAAVDLPVTALSSIRWAVEKLHVQLQGFDVFLGALVGTEVGE